MKLLVVSPDAGRLEALKSAASAHKQISTMSVQEGHLGESGTAAKVNGSTDVLLLDATRNTMQELDALEKIQVSSPRVQAILLAPSEDPQVLLRALRLGVKEVLTPDTIEAELEPALNRVVVTAPVEKSAPRAKTFVFASSKGGCGGTFLAANFAHNLALDEEKRVLLIDLDVKNGNAHLMLSERRPLVTLADLSRDIHRVDSSFLESAMVDILPNFGILASPESGLISSDVRATSVETLLSLAQSMFDYVIVDVGRAVNSVSVKAFDVADLVFPVTQLSVPHIREARRLVMALRSLEFMPGKIRLIVNRHEKVRNLTVADLEKAAGVSDSILIPNDYAAVSEAVNQGHPIAKQAKGSGVNKALNRMIAEVVLDAPPQSGWLSRVMKR